MCLATLIAHAEHIAGYNFLVSAVAWKSSISVWVIVQEGNAFKRIMCIKILVKPSCLFLPPPPPLPLSPLHFLLCRLWDLQDTVSFGCETLCCANNLDHPKCMLPAELLEMLRKILWAPLCNI